MASMKAPSIVDCGGLETREVNRAIRQAIVDGATDLVVRNPAGRHSLGVALEGDVRVTFDGPVGWYAAGMNSGPEVVVLGNAGWAVGECMMRGRIEVRGHAGSGTAASIRGGAVVIEGDSGARSGISMKGGTLVIGGNSGYMTGFMMQLGTIVVCGDVADGVGDSMYEGTIYVGGSVASRGADAEFEEMTDPDLTVLRELLRPLDVDPSSREFTKIRSGRRLWNFSEHEPELWTSAL